MEVTIYTQFIPLAFAFSLPLFGWSSSAVRLLLLLPQLL